MNDKSINDLTDEYFGFLSNINKQQQKCVVLFSGVPGSGKTRIARAIENELKAVRISNDDIRDLIVASNPSIGESEREHIKLQIVTALLQHLETARNGLIVFDVSCDRPGGYDYYHSWAQNHGYRTVLLRLIIPREVIVQRIRERGDSGYRIADQSLANLDTWWRQWKVFGEEHEPDLVITSSTSIEKIVDLVKAKASRRGA